MMAQGQSDFIQFILIHMKYYTLKQKEKALPVLVLRFGMTTNLLSAYALSFPIHSCLSVAKRLSWLSIDQYAEEQPIESKCK